MTRLPRGQRKAPQVNSVDDSEGLSAAGPSHLGRANDAMDYDMGELRGEGISLSSDFTGLSIGSDNIHHIQDTSSLLDNEAESTTNGGVYTPLTSEPEDPVDHLPPTQAVSQDSMVSQARLKMGNIRVVGDNVRVGCSISNNPQVSVSASFKHIEAYGSDQMFGFFSNTDIATGFGRTYNSPQTLDSNHAHTVAMESMTQTTQNPQGAHQKRTRRPKRARRSHRSKRHAQATRSATPHDATDCAQGSPSDPSNAGDALQDGSSGDLDAGMSGLQGPSGSRQGTHFTAQSPTSLICSDLNVSGHGQTIGLYGDKLYTGSPGQGVKYEYDKDGRLIVTQDPAYRNPRP